MKRAQNLNAVKNTNISCPIFLNEKNYELSDHI